MRLARADIASLESLFEESHSARSLSIYPVITMEQKDYRLAAIMYTDIAGFSRMMERDEAGTLELLAYHNELIAGIVERHHGTVIKTIGDALLIDFKNTVEALQSAMEVQDKLYEHNKENPGLPLLVRIGVHLGDIYFFENDALGEGINIAARLQSLARPGCICFSQDVYNLVLNKIEFRAEKLGKVSLKNITKEIHAYEITTPNVEFDPERGKPRPGYKPGSYLDDESEDYIPVGGVSSSAGPFSSRAVATQAAAGEPARSEPTGKPAGDATAKTDAAPKADAPSARERTAASRKRLAQPPYRDPQGYLAGHQGHGKAHERRRGPRTLQFLRSGSRGSDSDDGRPGAPGKTGEVRLPARSRPVSRICPLL